ncbi:uncharacterized protein LOC130771319 [Actinidia eriantha]|uniref:uncharacterized protein LOC130771319 n=1 Tax=Actinidia eriantha TaxID=165200 RepID=UPI00258559F8|nr:uncharacterized protein LOC130771319 [Actinidia eriantha]
MIVQVGLNYMREPSEKMKFTNLSQCSKLVAAALCDANSGCRDDGISAFKQKEEASAFVNQLEITLELQRERNDSMIALPSVINLSVERHRYNSICKHACRCESDILDPPKVWLRTVSGRHQDIALKVLRVGLHRPSKQVMSSTELHQNHRHWE